MFQLKAELGSGNKLNDSKFLAVFTLFYNSTDQRELRSNLRFA